MPPTAAPAPPCPELSRCGGCAWMHRPLPDQRQQLQDDVERAISHPVDELVTSPQTEGYRLRLRLRPGPDGRLGLTRPRSHDAVPLASCAVAHPRLNEVLERLPELPGFAAVELRTNGREVVLAASSRRRSGPRKRRGPRGGGELRKRLVSLDLGALGLAGVALDGDRVAGQPRLELSVDGEASSAGLQASAASFFQVNGGINAAVVARVGALVRSLAPAHLLDLYAGNGNLSLGLAGQGFGLTLIESSPSAVRDARETVARRGLQGTVDVRRGDAGAFQPGDCFFDVAVLDPPRAGAPGLLPRLLTTRPRALLYLSCNPRALGRDLGALRGSAWRLAHTTVYEMFPHTGHAEVLAVVLRDDQPLPVEALGEKDGEALRDKQPPLR